MKRLIILAFVFIIACPPIASSFQREGNDSYVEVK